MSNIVDPTGVADSRINIVFLEEEQQNGIVSDLYDPETGADIGGQVQLSDMWGLAWKVADNVFKNDESGDYGGSLRGYVTFNNPEGEAELIGIFTKSKGYLSKKTGTVTIKEQNCKLKLRDFDIFPYGYDEYLFNNPGNALHMTQNGSLTTSLSAGGVQVLCVRPNGIVRRWDNLVDIGVINRKGLILA